MKYQGLTLDPFQIEAVNAIDHEESLIVSAPTGCGKTLIAEYAVDRSMEAHKRVVYTAPIKALSNQKYRDFKVRFGEEVVGIHTGDVTINPQAPLLIMTTEIFRNLILEGSPRLCNIHYLVFDEVHYLDDEERGTVWEECIILAPLNIRLLCLSATVPNIEELAGWMGAVRNTKFIVIREAHRPVPLQHYLYSAKYGRMNLKGIRRKYRRRLSERKKFLRHRPSAKRIVRHVVEEGNFPVLYFCFNRRACERNARMHTWMNLLDAREKLRVVRMVDDLVAQYQLDGYDRLDSMRPLWEAGCAYHHAGILPAAKEIVERLFTAGLIKLLFCTETFALGINMPASSVVFDELERFNGVDFAYLTTRHYHQMAGRAGRRGMDEVGHVYSQIVPEATDPDQVHRILYGENERIVSRFSASYATVMSLYCQFGEQAYDIFRKSLQNYKQGRFALTKSYRREETQIRNRIAFLQSTGFLDGTSPTSKGRLAAVVNGYEIQAAELYYSGSLDDSSPQDLCVVLAALVTEESRRKKGATSDLEYKFRGEKVVSRLRRLEIKHNIAQPIRKLDFALAAPVLAWANGCSLAELESSGIPEGDMVRVLRMTIQLLRTLRDALTDDVMSERMHHGLLLLNRDVVDAQAQLEVG